MASIEQNPRPLKFYIAGSFGKREEMRELMAEVERRGHAISADWTTHLPIKPYEENLELAAEYAEEDLEGAKKCNIFVLIPEKTGGGTQFSELGAAIASKSVQRVFVVGPHNNRSMAFFHPKVERVDSIEEVFKRAGAGRRPRGGINLVDLIE